MPKLVQSPRDVFWLVRQNDDGTYNDNEARRALLLDIREHLRALRRVLECPNFLAIPSKLNAIVKHTKPKKKRRTRKKVQA